MTTNFYLIVNDRGTTRTVSTKYSPNLKGGEIAILMNMTLPSALFSRPQLSAEITVPESAILSTPLNADVKNNIKAAIEEVTGLTFDIKVLSKENEETSGGVNSEFLD